MLQGLGIADLHCTLSGATMGDKHIYQVVNQCPDANRLLVNGEAVLRSPCRLYDQDRLIVGWAHAFRLVAPRLGRSFSMSAPSGSSSLPPSARLRSKDAPPSARTLQ